MSTLESLHRGSGDYRIVWEVVYASTWYHRGGEDGDGPVTHTTREQTVKHVISPTFPLARAMAVHKYGFGDNEIVSVTPLCTIDDEMDLTRGWRA